MYNISLQQQNSNSEMLNIAITIINKNENVHISFENIQQCVIATMNSEMLYIVDKDFLL